MNKQFRIYYITISLMLVIYIVTLTPGLSDEFIVLFSNPMFNITLILVILMFTNINNRITLLLIIAYVLTTLYINETRNVENMITLYGINELI